MHGSAAASSVVGTAVSAVTPASPATTNPSSSGRYLGLPVIGLAIGGFIGFLMRPSALLIGQLPLGTVIMRGSNLSGLDALLVPTAQASFNAMVAGAIVGAVTGVVVHVAIRAKH